MPAPPGTTLNGGSTPYVEIIEQPSAKSTRFRYECEGRFAGSILGKTANSERKTFPSIKVHHHHGACVVVVSLVTHDDGDKPKPHPHTLVGPECRQGVCTKKVKQGLDNIQFPNLGIQCKKKAELKDALTLRQQIRVDPFRTGFDHMEKPQLNNINLMVVKLCFQVFLPDESGKYQRPLMPVCSTAIHDKKSAGELSIHSYLPESCPVAGKEEMILLTGRLPKADELEVRFYEGQSDKPEWEGLATFTQKDIHQSVALTVRIPEYTKQTTRSKQQVQIQLRKRHSPSETSASRKFFYLTGDSRNRHRPSKRELEEAAAAQYGGKRIKNDPGAQHQDPCVNGESFAPSVLDTYSVETTSSGGSAFNSGGSAGSYLPNAGTGYAPQSHSNQQQHQQPQQMQYPLPYSQQPLQIYQVQPDGPDRKTIGGQEVMKVRLSDINVYRNDDSGRVFMAPGLTAPNRNAPEVEISEDVFGGLEIEEILRMARNNPDSEIYIPSGFSEHLNVMLNQTMDVLEDEVVRSSADSEQPHTTSLTKELKSIN